MQLDVLSVFQLQAASSSQPGPFFLQEDGALTLKEFQEQHQRGFSWSSTCSLLPCSRRARYAVDLDSATAAFALIKRTAKPSAWALIVDADSGSSSVRVEPLRGHLPQPRSLHAPHALPYDELLGIGLPPNFERGESLTDGSVLPPSMASCQVVVEPASGVSSPRTQLIAHAYWWSTCPGKLVLAVARHDAKGLAPGPSLRSSWGTNGGMEDWHSPQKQALLWRWLVLHMGSEFEYVGLAAQRRRESSNDAVGLPASPSEPELQPTLAAVRMSWHPQGHALALCLTDVHGRNCVAALDGNGLEVLWHRRLGLEADGLASTGGVLSAPSVACASAMAWVPNSSLLALIDTEGHLHLLDARGAQRGAVLVCGAIIYGESTSLRLGPILGKAAPLPAGASTAAVETMAAGRSARRDRSGFGVCICSSGGGAGGCNGDSHIKPGSGWQPGFSLAFSDVKDLGTGTTPDASAAVVASTDSATVMMAVCNGTAVALLRVQFPKEPATPVVDYRQVFARDAVTDGGGAAADGGLATAAGSPVAQAKQAEAVNDSPDRDLVPALRPSGLQVQVDGLENASTVGNSAVSTPYMLGLQRVSIGSSTATGAALQTSRSTVSEAPAPPAWPLRWRTILTLPPPGAAVAVTSSAAAYIDSHGSMAVMHKAGGGGCPPPSLSASSVTAATKLDRGGGGGTAPAGGWGAFPSPAASTANLLDLYTHEAGSFAAGDAVPAAAAIAADGGSLARGDAHYGTHIGAGMGPAGVAPWPEVLLCTSPGALQALRQGDVVVLRGSIAESLQHYPRAHVYGFLPAFLALVHLHRIDAAARLLRAYAHFTGQVAMACGEAGSGGSACSCAEAGAAAAAPAPADAGSPLGPSPRASVMAQQWQATMTSILDGAFSGYMATSMAGMAGPGGAGGGNALRPSHEETLPKWQTSLQRVQENPATSESEDVDDCSKLTNEPSHQLAANAATAVAQDGVTTSAATAAAKVMVSYGQHYAGLHGNKSNTLSAPGAEAVEDRVSYTTVPASDSISEAGAAAPGVTAAAAAAGGGGADGAADASEEPVSLLPGGGDGGYGSPLPSPSSALRDMLRVCLELLLLACHSMAFVAFSAHSAGRAVVAAAAADVLALSLSPASPRSHGGSVLSRQAMRRLSSTVRMRSLKTRSNSMYGSPSHGTAGPLSPSPSAQLPPSNSVGAVSNGSALNAAQLIGRTASSSGMLYHGGAAGSAATAAAAGPTSRQPPAAASMVIGFPIPVVWQPQPHSHPPEHLSSSLAAARGGAGGAISHLAGTGRSAGPQCPASGTSANFSRAGTFGGGGMEPAVALTATGSAATSSSAPGSPISARHPHPSPPPPGSMRLQLHHCAFDVTRLWQEASAQQLPLGQSAATVYLKPSYAAGLLLMAHACNVQLQELQQHHHNQHRYHHNREHQRYERLHQRHASSTDERQQQQQQQQTHGQGPEGKPQLHPQLDPYLGSLPHHHQNGVLRSGGGGAVRAPRVNWQLLRATAAATQAAAVWQQLNDWHRAALLVFACANTLTLQGAGAEDLALEPPGGGRRRRASEPGAAPATASSQEAPQSAANGAAVADAGADAANGLVAKAGAPSGRAGRCSILAAARASCLRMGQRVLLSQVEACQKMEVQDACGMMLELVALPRRLLGLHSAVHISLLQKVCTRMVDLLPARISITPLLPAGSVPPLLQLSHAGIRSQLVAHCGAAVARVLEELRLAAACGGGLVSLREAIHQIADHSTVDSCVRMLLRWQGSYDGVRVDAAAARLAESVQQDATLLPDTSDWSLEAVLPSLQDAFITSGLLSIPDATAVVKAAHAAAAAAATDSGSQLVAGALEEAPGGGKGSTGASSSADKARGLQDLDELALLLDLTQLQHTLLASLQPFLHDALLVLRGPSETTGAAGAMLGVGGGGVGGDGGARPGEGPQASASGAVAATATGIATFSCSGEEEHEEELADSRLLAALPPVELAASCLKLLLRLQWAMHCRAQVCALMLQLVRLQAHPQPVPVAAPSAMVSPPFAPTSPSTAPAASNRAPAVDNSATSAAAATTIGGGGSVTAAAATTACGGGPESAHRPTSTSSGQVLTSPSHTSPRSFSHASVGHRSFRDYIQHMASGSSPQPLPPQLDPQQPPQQQPQQPAPQPPQHPALEQQQQQNSYSRSGGLGLPVDPGGRGGGGGTGIHAAAAGPHGGGWPVPPPPLPLSDPSAELDQTQASLMAWTAALVRADVFHSSNELQGCVLTVLGVVKSCPLVLVTALNRALERREILNKALAEQVRRLQRSAPPLAPSQPRPPAAATAAASSPVPAAAAAAPAGEAVASASASHPSAFVASGTNAALLARGRSSRRDMSFVPGGAMGLAPSLAMGSGSATSSADAEAAVRHAASNPSPADAPGSAPCLPCSLEHVGTDTPLLKRGPGEGSFVLPAPPMLQSPELAASFGPTEAQGGLRPVAEAADDGTWDGDAAQRPPVPPTTAAAKAKALPLLDGRLAAQRPPTTSALRSETVAVDSATTTTTNNNNSNNSNNHDNNNVQVHPMQLAVAMAHADIRMASLKLLEYYADPSGAMPSGLSNAGGGGGHGSGKKARRLPRMLNRSSTVSRATSHSTLLQCLVCELVRTAHAVTASVSWKATLEGGRGLAGCFVHPILHGGSSAAVASAAAAAATAGTAASASPDGLNSPSGAACSRRRNAAGGGKGPAALAAAEEMEGLGSVPGFVPGAEGAQALLLSLLDVRQWGLEVKPLPVPSARNGRSWGALSTGRSSSLATTAAEAVAATEAAQLSPPLAEEEEEGDEEEAPAGEAEEVEEEDGVAGAAAAAEDDSYIDPGVTDDGGPRPFTLDSPHGNTSRLSFSGLTDGDNDSACYPNPAGTMATSGGDTKSSAGRQGAPSIRHHTNPAFGLHSPTPSNLSEFWDETSDLASPRSTMVSPPTGPGSRPGIAAAAPDARLLWRVGSSPNVTEGGGTSPQGNRTSSSELTAMAAGGSFAPRFLGTPSTVSSKTASPATSVVSPAQSQPQPQSTSPAECSPRQQGERSSPAAGTASGVVGQPGGDASSNGIGARAQAVAEEAGEGARSVAATERTLGNASNVSQDGGGGGSGVDGEQLPTLSYLVNVNALADIRRAVREAHGDGGEEDADGKQGRSPPSPQMAGLSSSASVSFRAIDKGIGAAASAAAAPAAATCSTFSPPLAAKCSGSFGAESRPSNVTSASEISVRGGVALMLATGGWSGLEAYGAAATATELGIVKDAGKAPATTERVAGAAAAAMTTTMTCTAAAAATSAGGSCRVSDSQAPDRATSPQTKKDSELTFDSPASTNRCFANGLSTLPPRSHVPSSSAAPGPSPHRPLPPTLQADDPQLNASLHSPMPRQPSIDTASGAIIRGLNTAASPQLPLTDFFHIGLGAGLSPSRSQPGISSPSACSNASSISLATSPRLATAHSAGYSGPSPSPGPGQGNSTQPHPGVLPLQQPLQQPQQQTHQPKQPQEMQQQQSIRGRQPGSNHHYSNIPTRPPVTVAPAVPAAATPMRQSPPHLQQHQRSPRRKGSSSARVPGLQRSASASAATTTAAAAVAVASPRSPGVSPASTPMAACLGNPGSRGSTAAASTLTTPSSVDPQSQIKIQDFLREPSSAISNASAVTVTTTTTSNMSPFGLGSEYFRTPMSAGGSTMSAPTPTPAISLAGAGQDGVYTPPPLPPPPLQETNTWTPSSALSEPLGPAAAAGAFSQPYGAAGASTTRGAGPAIPKQRRSIDVSRSASARPYVNTPSVPSHAELSAAAAAASKHPQPQLRASKEAGGLPTWGSATSRRRPSYEAGHVARGIFGTGPAAAAAAATAVDVSGGGAAINPLYSARAAAVFGAGRSPEAGGRGSRASAGGGVGGGGGAEATGGQGAVGERGGGGGGGGGGGSRQQSGRGAVPSGRGGNSNTSTNTSTSRAAWH